MILRLTGNIVPKKRPIVTYNHAIMPTHYKDWQNAAIGELLCQWKGGTIDYPVAIRMDYIGKHHRASDGDNTEGSVLDALVKAEIIKKDNFTIVVGVQWRLFYDKTIEPYTEIEIQGI